MLELDAAVTVDALRLLLVAENLIGAGTVVDLLREHLPTAEVTVVEDLAAARLSLAVGPDLVLVDLSWPDADRLEVVAALRSASPDMAVVVVCGHGEDEFALRAIAAGADDCLVRGEHDGQLLTTVVARSLQRVRAQALRQRRIEIAASLLDATESPVCAVDASGRIVSVNGSWVDSMVQNGGDLEHCGVGVDYLAVCAGARGEVGGLAAEMAAGLRSVLNGDLARFELEYDFQVDDIQRWFSARVAPQREGHGAVISHVDVTASRLATRALARQTFYDGVTGLPGRALLADRLEQALAEGARSGYLVAVALVDVDQHAAVLEAHGSEVANTMLVQAAERLAACVRDGDTLAFLTGARFVAVWRGVRSRSHADELTTRLCRAFTAPFLVAGTAEVVTATVGMAVDQWAETGDELLLAAAAAMREALDRGPGQVRVVAPPQDAPRLRTEAALREAMLHGDLVVHYQPVMDLARGVAVGVEALVRWQHPVDGLIGPDSFIPVAESGGLIVALGAWVLEQACAQAVRWHDGGLDLHVAVNLSMRQVAHPDVVRTVKRALHESGLAPQYLVLEVTESAVSEDAEAAATVLSELAGLGVGLSIDDFGTGYSSLVYLKRYPIGSLKVDRSFVAGMGSSERDDAIVASVLALSRAVGGSCIAEGVETPEQYAALVALGCEFGQGWLFGRAVPADELPDLVVGAAKKMAALRAGIPVPRDPADRRQLAGDRRDEVADRRDDLAGRRDDQAGLRDDVAGRRDDQAGRRDDVAGRRDDQAGRRDDVAGVRDDVAGHRDDQAGRRDDVAGVRDDVAGLRDDVAGRRDDQAGRRDDVAGVRDDQAGRRDDQAGRRDDVAGHRDDVAGRRDDQAGLRDEVAQARDQAGDARDQQGERRDRAGAARDRVADLRDLEADRREHAADERDVVADHRDAVLPGSPGSVAAARFASERRQAASDRVLASHDRRAGATERTEAERERGTAEVSRGTAEVSRGTAEVSRGTAELDRGTAEVDRGTARVDRGTARVDRGAAAADRGTAEVSRGTAEVDRGTARVDRGAAAADRGTAREDRGSAEVDRGSAEIDRDTAEVDRGSARVERGTAEAERDTAEIDRDTAEVDRDSAEVDRGTAQAHRYASSAGGQKEG